MAEKPTALRHSELLGSMVLDRATTEERGRVEALWMYPQSHRILGFICKVGLLGNKRQVFKLPQIHSLGNRTIWTQEQPAETDSDRVKQLESLMGLEVWSEAGERLGVIKDCLFNLTTGQISQYFVSVGRLPLVKEISLDPQAILSHGRQKVLVADRFAEKLAQKNPSLRDRLNRAQQGLRSEITQATSQVTGEIRHLRDEAQTAAQAAAQKAAQQAERLKQEAAERAELLRQEAQQRTLQLRQEAVERAEVIKRETLERSADWREEVVEVAQVLRREASGTFQQLQEQAARLIDESLEPDLEGPGRSPRGDGLSGDPSGSGDLDDFDFENDFGDDFENDFGDDPADRLDHDLGNAPSSTAPKAQRTAPHSPPTTAAQTDPQAGSNPDPWDEADPLAPQSDASPTSTLDLDQLNQLATEAFDELDEGADEFGETADAFGEGTDELGEAADEFGLGEDAIDPSFADDWFADPPSATPPTVNEPAPNSENPSPDPPNPKLPNPEPPRPRTQTPIAPPTPTTAGAGDLWDDDLWDEADS